MYVFWISTCLYGCGFVQVTVQHFIYKAHFKTLNKLECSRNGNFCAFLLGPCYTLLPSLFLCNSAFRQTNHTKINHYASRINRLGKLRDSLHGTSIYLGVGSCQLTLLSDENSAMPARRHKGLLPCFGACLRQSKCTIYQPDLYHQGQLASLSDQCFAFFHLDSVNEDRLDIRQDVVCVNVPVLPNGSRLELQKCCMHPTTANIMASAHYHGSLNVRYCHYWLSDRRNIRVGNSLISKLEF